MEVVSIMNLSCRVCTGRIAYPTREEERRAPRISNVGLVADHVENVYDCRTKRYYGWHIIMYLHGRYSKTIVQTVKFWLEGRDLYKTSGPEALVARHQTPWPFDIRYLMGCDDNPRDSRSELKTGFEPGIIRIGKSLRWKTRDGLSGTTLLPIAHLIIGFTPMD